MTDILEGCRRDKIPNKRHVPSSNIYKRYYTLLIFSRKYIPSALARSLSTSHFWCAKQFAHRGKTQKEADEEG